MAGIGGAGDRARSVPGAVLARAVAVAAAARARRRRDRFCRRHRRGAGAAGTAAHAGDARGPDAGSIAAAGSPIVRRPRSPTSSRSPSKDPYSLALWNAHVERALGGGARAQSRQAGAARRLARSLCAARAGAARLHRHVFCRRRRTLEARRRGVRLAGRGAAGEFPRRRLGGAAGLYRQAAAGAARHSSRRNGDGAGAGRRTLRGAGQFDADRALDRQRQSRHFRQWRRDAIEGSGAGAGRHRGASLCDHRHRHARRCAAPATI